MSAVRRAPALLLAPAALAFLVLFAAPLGWLLATSLGAPHWTARNYARIAGSGFWLATFGQTFLLGALVAAATTALGVPLAWWLARLPVRRAAPLLALVTVPLWTSAVVRSFAWVVLLGRAGLISQVLAGVGLPPLRLLQTLPAVVVALTQVLLPVTVLTLYGAVRGIDPTLEAAARTLGATRLRAAIAVTLPLVQPAVLSAATLTAVLAIGAVVTPNLVGGARVHLIAGAIFDEVVELADWPFAAALSVALLVAVLAVLLVHRRFAPTG